jgi:NADH-quinone oxidoreductase subunit N
MPPLVAVLGSLRLPTVDWNVLWPEAVLIGMPLVMLLVRALAGRRLPVVVWTVTTVVAGLGSGVLSYRIWQEVGRRGPHTAIAGALAVDRFSVLFLILVSAAVVLFALAMQVWMERERESGPEPFVLAMLSGAGAMVMASGNDLIVIFLGLEILSIALYVMAALDRRRERSGEAGLKYFVLGAFSSALFLYGIALVYGATGSTNLGLIARFLSRDLLSSPGVLLAGLALLLVGLGFKVAAVPFHTWTPDVYQGSPSPVTGFMAAVAKAGGFAALVRILEEALPTLRLDWQPVLWALAALSLVVGAALAVVQRDVKRMLAYSSISHAGFILVGVEVATTAGASAVGLYLLSYAFMIMGSFTVVAMVGATSGGDHDLSHYRGLARREPLLALLFALLLVAQAGVPLTTGFSAKFDVIVAAVDARNYALAILAMVAAVIVAFFYLRLVVAMYSGSGVGEPAGETDSDDLLPPSPALEPAQVREPVLVGGVGLASGEVAAALAAEARATGPARPVPAGARLDPHVPTPVVERVTNQLALRWPGATIGVVVAVVFTLAFGFFPAPLVDFARHALLLR